MKDKYELLLSAAASTYENIKFADTKATVLLAIYTAFLGVISSRLSALGFAKMSDVYSWLLIASLLSLAAGIICLLLAIWPRAKDHDQSGIGFLHSDRILKAEDAEHLVRYIDDEGLDESAVKQQIAELAYGRSKNNERKYRLIRYALVCGIVGLLIGSLAIVMELMSQSNDPTKTGSDQLFGFLALLRRRSVLS